MQRFSSTLNIAQAFQLLSSFPQIPLTAYLDKERFSLLLGDVTMGCSVLERTVRGGVEGHYVVVRRWKAAQVF